jgi:Kef-type K+ transport system membrane component KefB
MVGFLLGEKLELGALRRHGRLVVVISVTVVLVTAASVLAGLLLLGVPAPVALLLASVATATDPVATFDVVHEARTRGRFSDALLGIVAFDDAWGLIVFSLLLAVAQALAGGERGVGPLALGAWELGGALLVGLVLGLPMALLTGRIRPGEPMLAEALGFVLLCGGIALWLEVSYLLAAMVLGAVVANRARHHTRPFHAIEGIEWPFTILFFVLAGAAVDLGETGRIGAIGAAYVALRVAGRIAGGWLGARLAHGGPTAERWMGVALLPQAGVALGMALIAAERFPAHAAIILPVAIGATVLFELMGPVLTRLALRQAAAGR